MPELPTKITAAHWPEQAQIRDVSFTFSGTFDAARIAAQSAGDRNLRVLKHLLEFIGAVGLVALGASAFIAWLDNTLGTFLVARHFINLIFWVSVLSDCYLWTILQSEKQRHTALDLLHLDNFKSWPGRAEGIDAFALFTPAAQTVWNNSVAIAAKHQRSGPVLSDVFSALLQNSDVRWLFLRLGIDASDLQMAVETFPANALPEPELFQLPFAAVQEAIKLHNRAVDPLMLLCALCGTLPADHPLQRVLVKLDIAVDKLEIVAAWIFHVELFAEDYKTFRRLSRFHRDSEVNAGLTSVPTPYLDQFSEDLSWAAKYGRLPLSLGREEDVAKLFALMDSGRSRILITGPLGTGRTTLVNQLAYRMVTEEVPKPLQDKRLVKLELAGILGSKLPAEQVLMEALQEAEKSGNIVFVIEDIHQLANASSSRGLSLLEIFVNHLQESPLTIVATTTLEDYQNALRPSANFDQVFTTYELSPLSENAVVLACCFRATMLENKTKTFFTYQAIVEAVRLTNQFGADVGQPEKAIEVLTEAAERAIARPEHERMITPKEIQEIMGEKTHVPQASFTENEADKLLNLEQLIGDSVIGQKPAVTAVAEALRRARSGLSSGSRPQGSFLFVGPTGVGKTELARTLAKVYFGDEKFLLRLDMSEYQGSDGMEKLLGTPDSKNLTPFVNHLKNYPFCLFLLDEFEKASGEVLNLFLRVLEDGRLTTTAGKTLDLTHTIIIATSNAGTPEIQAGLKNGEKLETIRQRLFNEILVKQFRPELLNRFDGIILFSPLSPDEVQQITKLQLAGLVKNLAGRGVTLAFSDALVADVAVKAFDPLLGARPIRRYIQDHVESELAKLLLSNPPARGSSVTMDLENGQVVLK
jgi:ATP-dependent Clp protease ATP-binding subunit ClpC